MVPEELSVTPNADSSVASNVITSEFFVSTATMLYLTTAFFALFGIKDAVSFRLLPHGTTTVPISPPVVAVAGAESFTAYAVVFFAMLMVNLIVLLLPSNALPVTVTLPTFP